MGRFSQLSAELTTVAELIVGVLFRFSLDRLDEYSFCCALCLLHLFIFVCCSSHLFVVFVFFGGSSVWTTVRPLTSRFSSAGLAAASPDRFRQQVRTERVLTGQKGCRSAGQNRLQTLLGRMWQQLLPWLTFRPWCCSKPRQARPVT